MILAVDEQKQLLEDVILVFPQPITLNSFSSFEEHVDQGEKFLTKEKKDPSYTVVSNKKGKAKMQMRDGITFKNVAKVIKIIEGETAHTGRVQFKDGKGKGKVVPGSSQPL